MGAQQQMAEAAQAAERHLKCKVLQLKPYRKADKGKATGADRKEVHMPFLQGILQGITT